MRLQILVGLLMLSNAWARMVNENEMLLSKDSALNLNYQMNRKCILTNGELCYQTYDCCKSPLVCSGSGRICQCPSGYDWSDKYEKCYRCPNGWVFFENECYFISNELRSWNSANDDCKSKNGILASFDSEVVVDRLTEFVKDNNLLSVRFHVGARTYNLPGNWSWLSGARLPAYGPWWTNCFTAANDNGNNKKLGDACASTVIPTAITLPVQLEDVNCETANQRYICEYVNQNRSYAYGNNKYGNNQNYNNNNNDNRYSSYKTNYVQPVQRCKEGQRWSSKQGKCVKCPTSAGWNFVNDICFFASTDARSFTDATTQCTQLGASLLVANTDYIIDVLAPLFRVANLGSNSYWIGAQGASDLSTWSWINTANTPIPIQGLWWYKPTGTCDGPVTTANYRCVSATAYSIENRLCSDTLKYLCRLN